MDNPFIVGIIAWLIPGGGHLVQRRYVRGAIIAGVVWLMFVIAIISGGSHYPGYDFKDSSLLFLLNVFARAGNGIGAVVSYLMASVPAKDVAALATFEYGGRFLEVAGLVNYLAALDAADIATGRKS